MTPAPKRPPLRVCIYVRPDVGDALQSEAAARGCTVNKIAKERIEGGSFLEKIRQIVREELDREK